MTAQTLYNRFQKDEISKEKFLYEVRKQSHLPITKFNSFEDTIQILKTRGLISEEIGKYKADKNVPFPKQEIKTIDQVSPHEYAKGINYEFDLFEKSVGQNMPTDEELSKVQEKVLRNLSNDEYYYTKKCMSDIEKKQEKANLRDIELGKDLKAKNQLEKGKTLKENLDQEEQCEGCMREDHELEPEQMNPSQLKVLGDIIEEWGLTEQDVQDEDVLEELADEFQKRWGLEEIKVEKPSNINSELRSKLIDIIYRYMSDEANPNQDESEYDETVEMIENAKTEEELINIMSSFLQDEDLAKKYVLSDEALGEAIAVKDKAGNIQYAKDDSEATDIVNQAKQKGVQLTKQNI